jgi:hypothetical protein
MHRTLATGAYWIGLRRRLNALAHRPEGPTLVRAAQELTGRHGRTALRFVEQWSLGDPGTDGSGPDVLGAWLLPAMLHRLARIGDTPA